MVEHVISHVKSTPLQYWQKPIIPVSETRSSFVQRLVTTTASDGFTFVWHQRRTEVWSLGQWLGGNLGRLCRNTRRLLHKVLLVLGQRHLKTSINALWSGTVRQCCLCTIQMLCVHSADGSTFLCENALFYIRNQTLTNRCVFTWRTILPDFMPIQFEMAEGHPIKNNNKISSNMVPVPIEQYNICIE